MPKAGAGGNALGTNQSGDTHDFQSRFCDYAAMPAGDAGGRPMEGGASLRPVAASKALTHVAAPKGPPGARRAPQGATALFLHIDIEKTIEFRTQAGA